MSIESLVAPATEQEPTEAPEKTEGSAPEQVDPAVEPAVETEGQQADEETKPVEEQKTDSDPYEGLAVPEGVELPEGAFDDLKALGKEFGWSKETIEGLAKREHTRALEAEKERLAQVAEWRSEVEADRQLGGDNLQRTALRIQTALKGHQELASWLNETGMEFNIHVARFLESHGAAASEPSKVVHGNVPVSSGGLSAREMYPKRPEIWGEG